MSTPALRAAARRGLVPLALGVACLVVAWPAIEDLDRLLKGLGTILVVLGVIIVVASARTYTAEEKRIGPGQR
jgi:hypothetical protein